MKRIFTAIIAAALVASSSYADAAPKKTDWVIGSGADPSGPYQVIAEAKGFFKKHGLNITVKIFSSATRSFRAMLAGELDAANSGSFAPVNTLAQGSKKFRIVASTRLSQSGFTAVVARPGIDGPKGLSGGKVGIAQGSPSSHMWWGAFESHFGLKGTKMLWLQPQEQLIAFSKGEIAAVSIWFPWAGKAMKVLPGAKMLALDKDVGFVNDTPITMSKRLLADRDAAKALLRAFIDADEFLASNPDESAKIVSKAFNIPLNDTKAISKTIRLKVLLSDGTFKDLCQALNFQTKIGKITGKPDWKSGIDHELLREVAPERTTYTKAISCS